MIAQDTEDSERQTTRGAREGGSVAGLQRRRLLAATTELLGEGARVVSVSTICARAGVSRRTFYEIFEDREACLLATFSHTVGRAEAVIAQAVEDEVRWRDSVRASLSALLDHFDREPAEARLLIVEALRAGDDMLQARGTVLERLAHAVDGGRAEAKRQPPVLTAEGVVGAVLSIAHGRILSGDSLADLTGPFAAMIVQPYLGLAAARRAIGASHGMSASADDAPSAVHDENALRDLPMRLTYRTALVIRSIAEHPGSSNKQIASAAGVSDPGQISRLLARLERYGLAHNSGGEPSRGEAKAWTLTRRGEGVLQVVGGD